MLIPDTPEPGRFCWLDLAATDAVQARQFYAHVFGWHAQDQAANGGHFTRLRSGGHDTGSLYQLAREQLAGRVPSHWTPYIAVADVAETLRVAERAGGRTIVPPVAIDRMALIAVIEDAVGALVGLWQSLPDHAAPGPSSP
jgi:predicted enzyme related to lactoylglutathione lyase